MARWAPQRRDVIEALATEILHNYGRGRAMVAIDGPEGVDTASFADDLAEAVRAVPHAAFRASVGAFRRPRAERLARGVDSAEGAYRDAYDYSVFRRVLVEPFRLGGSTGFVTAAFDADRDERIEPKWRTGPADALLIVDGEFLNRPELHGLWNYSAWLHSEAVPESGAQSLYAAETNPVLAAFASIDVTDPEHPRRVFSDSC